ncbi:MAG: hypothetical protein ACRDNM_09855 [Gaiellaceae bacterium]
MKTICTLAVLVAILGGSAASAHAGGPGPQAPVQNGCLPGYHLMSVADLSAAGYGVPALLDNPANGGNGNGIVCGKRISEAAAEQLCGGEHGPDATCPVPIVYDFADDNA